MLNYLYFEQENWDKVVEILGVLQEDYPSDDYARRLNAVRGILDDQWCRESLRVNRIVFSPSGSLHIEKDLWFTGLSECIITDVIFKGQRYEARAIDPRCCELRKQFNRD